MSKADIYQLTKQNKNVCATFGYNDVEQKTARLLSCENEVNCIFLNICTLQFCKLSLIITTLKREGEICTIKQNRDIYKW
jgi:hypothetical protein